MLIIALRKKLNWDCHTEPGSIAFLERKRYCHMMGIRPHCGEDLGCSVVSAQSSGSCIWRHHPVSLMRVVTSNLFLVLKILNYAFLDLKRCYIWNTCSNATMHMLSYLYMSIWPWYIKHVLPKSRPIRIWKILNNRRGWRLVKY